MGDLFGAFQKVSPQNKNNSFDQIAAYEEYYMKLLKRYQGDIQNIEEMMENLRKERKDFYLKELPAIQKAMVEDDVLSNDCKAEWLTDGFETAAPTETKYDPYEMQEMWMERQGDFPGYNCRITAYELMGDRITAGEDQPDTNGEDWLFMDLETLKRDPDALCGKSTADFCALFAPVEAAGFCDDGEDAGAGNALPTPKAAALWAAA